MPPPRSSSARSRGTHSQVLSAPKVLIAVGGAPTLPDAPGVAEHGITSDGFFEMTQQPKSVAIFGAGYIAVELAGVLQGLGTQVTLFTRKDGALRAFDALVWLLTVSSV